MAIIKPPAKRFAVDYSQVPSVLDGDYFMLARLEGVSRVLYRCTAQQIVQRDLILVEEFTTIAADVMTISSAVDTVIAKVYPQGGTSDFIYQIVAPIEVKRIIIFPAIDGITITVNYSGSPASNLWMLNNTAAVLNNKHKNVSFYNNSGIFDETGRSLNSRP